MRVKIYCVRLYQIHIHRDINCHKLNCVSFDITTTDNQDYSDEVDDDEKT